MLFNKKEAAEKKAALKKVDKKEPTEVEAPSEETVTTKDIARDVFKMLPSKEAREEFEHYYNEYKRLSDLQEDMEKIKKLQE